MKMIKKVFRFCSEKISRNEFSFIGIKPDDFVLSDQKVCDETTNFLLFIAAKKADDFKRFKKVYDYICLPNHLDEIQDDIDKLSYLDILNYLSPGSKGFPTKQKTCEKIDYKW